MSNVRTRFTFCHYGKQGSRHVKAHRTGNALRNFWHTWLIWSRHYFGPVHLLRIPSHIVLHTLLCIFWYYKYPSSDPLKLASILLSFSTVSGSHWRCHLSVGNPFGSFRDGDVSRTQLTPDVVAGNVDNGWLSSRNRVSVVNVRVTIVRSCM